MAKTKTAKTKAAKPAKPEPKMTPRQAVQSFNANGRTPWQKFCKEQKKGDLGRTLGLNETGLSINIEGNQEDSIKSIDKINDEFARLSTFWEATAAYGRQHYNGDGFCHRDGLTRVGDESLGILVAQGIEELAQRTVFKGSKVGSVKRDPTVADKILKAVLAWAEQRPKAIKANRHEQAYKLATSEVGGKQVANLEARS